MFIDVSELGEVEYIEVGGQKVVPSQVDMTVNFNKVYAIVASGNEIGLIVKDNDKKLIYIFTSDREASKAKLALLERLNK